MSVQDNVIYKPFAYVLGALVLFTVSIMFLANMVSPRMEAHQDPLVEAQLAERIRPVGMSRVEP